MEFDANKYRINESLTLREYQLKNLEMFRYFDDFCRKHDVTYYVCGGACIGALRHDGFIPWDCDVDVFVHRSDYERLQQLWNRYADTAHYAYDRSDAKHNMHAQCSGIKDNYTTYIRSHNKNEDMNHGIMLDIIPLDALSDHWLQRQVQKINGLIFCIFNAQRLPNQQGRLIRFISGIILSVFKSPRIRYKIWKRAEKRFSRYDIKNCRYVGELTTGLHNINIRFPKEWFSEASELQFEGKMIMGPTEPDKYLRLRYGNYMEYPPEKEQVPKMPEAFVDIHTPYVQYKGIQYCVK